MNSTKSEINSMKSGNQSEQNNYTAVSHPCPKNNKTNGEEV